MNKVVAITGTGEYLPQTILTSAAIDIAQGLNDGYTQKLTGITHRHFAGNETASEMAVKAIAEALAAANLTIDDVDLIIAACGTMEQSIPCNAAKVHALLNPQNHIPAFDINMTCLSSLSALDIASSLLLESRYKNILIYSSDIASVGLDWSKLESAAIFGDGAAAYVISTPVDTNQRIINAKFKTYSEGVDFCQIRGGGSLNHPSKNMINYADFGKFEMQGKEVYRLTAKLIPEFVDELLSEAELTISDINWIVPHQASHLALTHIQKRLGFPREKMVEILSARGNQIAASIPAALNDLVRNRPLKRGDKILFLGTSAGLSIGGMVLEY